ncbi:uncharacterized protein LOC128270075 [Anopheles cruzii]|uniref:uncharacterized protein LOC128270075 n=1 Tax=Anopheles cruzii TaxID=68878 RepID=UPI0022EC481A|nr:uncharacterized protein LOC128270075 [Anopheles cruzii]
MNNVTSSETDISPDGSISNGADAITRSEEIVGPIEESVESTKEISECSAATSRMYMNVNEKSISIHSSDSESHRTASSGRSVQDSIENPSLHFTIEDLVQLTLHESRDANTNKASSYAEHKNMLAAGAVSAAGTYARNSYGATDGPYLVGDDSSMNCSTLSAIIKAIKDSTESINRTISEKMRDNESLSRPRSAVSSSNSLPTAPRFHSLGANSPSPSVHTAQSTFHRSYSPGVVSDMVREIRENSRVREEALMAQMRTIMEERSWTQNETLKRLARDVEDLKRGFQSLCADVEILKTGLDNARSEVTGLNYQTTYLQNQLLAHAAATLNSITNCTSTNFGQKNQPVNGGGGGNGNSVRREDHFQPQFRRSADTIAIQQLTSLSPAPGRHAVHELSRPMVYEIVHNGGSAHLNPLPLRSVGLTVRDDLPTEPENPIDDGHPVIGGSISGGGGNVNSIRREDHLPPQFHHKVSSLSPAPGHHAFCNTAHEFRPPMSYEMVNNGSTIYQNPLPLRSSVVTVREDMPTDPSQDPSDGGKIPLRHHQLQTPIHVQPKYEEHTATLMHLVSTPQCEIDRIGLSQVANNYNSSMPSNSLAATNQDTMTFVMLPPSTGPTSGQSPALPRDNTTYVSLLTGPVTDL